MPSTRSCCWLVEIEIAAVSVRRAKNPYVSCHKSHAQFTQLDPTRQNCRRWWCELASERLKTVADGKLELVQND